MKTLRITALILPVALAGCGAPAPAPTYYPPAPKLYASPAPAAISEYEAHRQCRAYKDKAYTMIVRDGEPCHMVMVAVMELCGEAAHAAGETHALARHRHNRPLTEAVAVRSCRDGSWTAILNKAPAASAAPQNRIAPTTPAKPKGVEV